MEKRSTLSCELWKSETGSEAISTVATLSVGVTVLIALLGVGRIVTEQAGSKYDAVLAGAVWSYASVPETVAVNGIGGRSIAIPTSTNSVESVPTRVAESEEKEGLLRSFAISDDIAVPGGSPAQSSGAGLAPGLEPSNGLFKPGDPLIDPAEKPVDGKPGTEGMPKEPGKTGPVNSGKQDPLRDPAVKKRPKRKTINRKQTRTAQQQEDPEPDDANDVFEGKTPISKGSGNSAAFPLPGISASSGGGGTIGGNGFLGASSGQGSQGWGFGSQSGFPMYGQPGRNPANSSYGFDAPANPASQNSSLGTGRGNKVISASNDTATAPAADITSESEADDGTTPKEASTENNARGDTLRIQPSPDLKSGTSRPDSWFQRVLGMIGSDEDQGETNTPVDASSVPEDAVNASDHAERTTRGEGPGGHDDEDSESETHPDSKEADADELHVVDVVRPEDDDPCLLVRVGRVFDQIQIITGDHHLAFKAPPEDSFARIRLDETLVRPGQRIEVIGVNGATRIVARYEIPDLSIEDMAVTQDAASSKNKE